MDKRKLCGRRRRKLKPGEKRKSFQEFIDGIGGIIKERKEIEDLFKRVLIFKSEDVLEEMEIRKKNDELLQANMLLKAEASGADNAGGGFDMKPQVGTLPKAR